MQHKISHDSKNPQAHLAFCSRVSRSVCTTLQLLVDMFIRTLYSNSRICINMSA